MKLSKELKRLYTADGRIDGGRALEYVYQAMQKMSDDEFLRIATMPTPLRFGPSTRVQPASNSGAISARRLKSKLKRGRRA